MSTLDYDIGDARSRPWNDRAIIHLDLDAFFASVAQLDNPELRGKPIIVGSPHVRGVVSTCSYEARGFGVRSAMSSVQAQRLCPEAIWVPGDFKRYRQLSGLVFDILRAKSPYVLPISIDEAFCDITPDTINPTQPAEVALDIQQQVSELGITCSIGLGTNMTVAKIGSDYQKPRGLTVVYPGEERAFLAPLPIRSLSGIGAVTARRLEDLGIRCLGDLANLSDEDALLIVGSAGITQRDRARGIDKRPVRDSDPVKSVSNENTFADDLHTTDEVLREMRHLSEHVASRLRKKGLAGKTVTIKVRSREFETHSASKTLSHAVDDVAQIMPVVEELLVRIWREGQPVRLLGIGVSGFDERDEQLSLLEDSESAENLDEKKELSRNIDAIRERYGNSSIRRGV